MTHIQETYQFHRNSLSDYTSVESYLKINDVKVSDETILREVIFIVNKHFGTDVEKILFSLSPVNKFITLCFVRYLVIDRAIDWKLLVPMFKNKLKTYKDFYNIAMANQTQGSRRNNILISEHIDRMLGELNL